MIFHNHHIYKILQLKNIMYYLKLFNFYDIGLKKIQEDYYVEFVFEIKKNNIDFLYECIFVFDGYGALNKNQSMPHLIVDTNLLQNNIKDYFQKNEFNTQNLKTFF